MFFMGKLTSTVYSVPQVTCAYLKGSFDDDWWAPGSGHPFIHRMVRVLTPENTVPCAMHGQIRCPPRVLAIIWYALDGEPPPQPACTPCCGSLLFEVKGLLVHCKGPLLFVVINVCNRYNDTIIILNDV